MIPTAAEVEQFSEKVEWEFGLVFDEGRREQVREVLEARCAALELSAGAYLKRLDGDDSEWQAVAALLTVPESYFFRHSDHLRACMEIAVPARIAARREDRTLRMACLGCANGEEAYTIAMLLEEQAALPEGWQFRIRACDINPEALRRARRGVYTNWALRATSPAYRARYFRAEGNRFHIAEEVRRAVQFERCNVLRMFRAEAAGSLDVVFFRNVLIYFSPEAIRAAVNAVAHMLAPGGYLFLGPAETLRGVSEDFELCHTHETFYYRRKERISALIPFSPLHRGTAGGGTEAAPCSERPVCFAPEEGLAACAASPLPDTAWMDEIERSTQRISGLDRARRSRVAPAAAPARSRGRSIAEELHGLMQMFTAERYGELLESVKSLPREIAEDADVRLLEALAHLNRHEIGAAEEVCRAAVARDSMNASGHYILALCSEHAADFVRSAEHDRIAIYLDPTFAMPHLHLALIARRRGDAHTARRGFEKAILLLARESASRIAMFGGGFGREALRNLCRRELQAIGAA